MCFGGLRQGAQPEARQWMQEVDFSTSQDRCCLELRVLEVSSADGLAPLFKDITELMTSLREHAVYEHKPGHTVEGGRAEVAKHHRGRAATPGRPFARLQRGFPSFQRTTRDSSSRG